MEKLRQFIGENLFVLVLTLLGILAIITPFVVGSIVMNNTEINPTKYIVVKKYSEKSETTKQLAEKALEDGMISGAEYEEIILSYLNYIDELNEQKAKEFKQSMKSYH